jgi:hypothetical protein
MTVMLLQQTEREAEVVHDRRAELVERIGRAMHADGRNMRK